MITGSSSLLISSEIKVTTPASRRVVLRTVHHLHAAKRHEISRRRPNILGEQFAI
jgi:hypothetical protein